MSSRADRHLFTFSKNFSVAACKHIASDTICGSGNHDDGGDDDNGDDDEGHLLLPREAVWTWRSGLRCLRCPMAWTWAVGAMVSEVLDARTIGAGSGYDV